jgi:hypothetical protein
VLSITRNLLERELGTEAVEQPRTAAEYQRHNVQLEFVHEPAVARWVITHRA